MRQQNHPASRVLPPRKIDEFLGWLNNEYVPTRLDDTDDLDPGSSAVSVPEAFTYWILSGPVTLSELFIDHRD
jgi:hypothetical protein